MQHRAVLIIFPLNLQTITITDMLSSGGEGRRSWTNKWWWWWRWRWWYLATFWKGPATCNKQFKGGASWFLERWIPWPRQLVPPKI